MSREAGCSNHKSRSFVGPSTINNSPHVSDKHLSVTREHRHKRGTVGFYVTTLDGRKPAQRPSNTSWRCRLLSRACHFPLDYRRVLSVLLGRKLLKIYQGISRYSKKQQRTIQDRCGKTQKWLQSHIQQRGVTAATKPPTGTTESSHKTTRRRATMDGPRTTHTARNNPEASAWGMQARGQQRGGLVLLKNCC